MMSEKQVIVIVEDGFGRVQTSIATSLSAPQLMDKIMGIDEQQATIDKQSNRIEELERILETNYVYPYDILKQIKGDDDE
jgi:hypothetical protein